MNELMNNILVNPYFQDPLYWGFYMLWYIFEPLLFGVIGCQINIMSLDLNVVYKGIAIILISLCVSSISFHVTFSWNLRIMSSLGSPGPPHRFIPNGDPRQLYNEGETILRHRLDSQSYSPGESFLPFMFILVM